MNSSIGRTAIDSKVVMKLWAVSGGRCELCNRLLYSDLTFGTEGNFGENAHIHAVSRGGPRHKFGMTQEEKNQIENLMLLCEEHHHLIDSHPEQYGDGFLIEKKKQHEERIRRVTEIPESQSCRMVSFFLNVDQIELFNSAVLFRQAAVLSDLYPRQHPTIELDAGLKHRYSPDRESFELQAQDLQDEVQRWHKDLSEQEDAIALFALAPQPLLFKLGVLISDQMNVSVFQCHREGHKWAWPSDDESEVVFSLHKTIDGGELVALVIDLSAEVVDARISQALGTSITVYHLSIEGPNREFVKNRGIQASFVKKFRETMEIIKNENPKADVLHVFPAMPNSLAVRAGMDYMPKADLPLCLYEQATQQGGFFPALRIGG